MERAKAVRFILNSTETFECPPKERALLKRIEQDWDAPFIAAKLPEYDPKAYLAAVELRAATADAFLEDIRVATPSVYAQGIQAYNRRKLAKGVWTSDVYGDKVKDSSLLTSSTLQNTLGLSEAQKEKIHDAARENLKSLDALKTAHRKASTDLTTKKYEAILRVLSPVQSGDVRKLIGAPSPFQCIAEYHIVQPVKAGRGGPTGQGAFPVPASVRRPHADVEHSLNCVELTLLSMQSSLSELDLSNEQRDKLSSIIKKNVVTRDLDRNETKARVRSLINGEAESTDFVQELLLPHQLDRLTQFELAYRLGSPVSFGILSEELSEAIEVTGEQKREIAEIIEEYSDKFLGIQEKSSEQLRKEYAEGTKKLIGILNDTQRARYISFVGEIDRFSDR